MAGAALPAPPGRAPRDGPQAGGADRPGQTSTARPESRPRWPPPRPAHRSRHRPARDGEACPPDEPSSHPAPRRRDRLDRARRARDRPRRRGVLRSAHQARQPAAVENATRQGGAARRALHRRKIRRASRAIAARTARDGTPSLASRSSRSPSSSRRASRSRAARLRKLDTPRGPDTRRIAAMVSSSIVAVTRSTAYSYLRSYSGASPVTHCRADTDDRCDPEPTFRHRRAAIRRLLSGSTPP